MRQELFGFDDFDSGFRMMNTQTGNNTWFTLFALMKKIKKDLKKKDKSDALGRLFGVLLFATEDDTFIWDNEVCTLYGKGSCTYYVITFGGPERPPPYVIL